MNILVLNCGSSSVKFQLIATDLDRIAQNQDERLARGVIERIGGEAIITLRAEGRATQRSTAALRDTRAAIEFILRWACSEDSGISAVTSLADIQAVGHHVVHGGERFTDSALITDEVLRGCLTCANCTMVCPTCFCTTVEDTTDLTGEHAERWRRWDSCFTMDFSYIHGGSVRATPRSRYRQWMTHKLATWIDQFGESGCIGCGRCITWCPVGIDITEETRAIRETETAGSLPKGEKDGNA